VIEDPANTSMPLDHYVSQVHLKQFCKPASRHLFAVRKGDMKAFCARTKDVCRIEDGSDLKP
jgi:hypothetical protein